MKYYIDYMWHDERNDTWVSYDTPVDRIFYDKDIADYICKGLNEHRIIANNEKYVVKEVKE